MMCLRLFAWTVLAACGCLVSGRAGATAAEETAPAARRIVFLGDSITQAGAGPHGYISILRENLAKRQPAPQVELIGAGVSGNKVPDLERRLEKDVLQKQPDLVIIYIGINDVWHSQQGKGTPKDAFEAGLRRLVQQIREAKAQVVLATPSVIGEKTDGSNPLDPMLDEYAEVTRQVAQDLRVQLLDLRKAFLQELKRSNEQQATSGVLTSDGVHLNEKGNQFVAQQMEEALQASGSKSQPELLRHVVLFQFKKEFSEAQVQEVVTAFAALPQKIDLIVDFERGTDVSVENKAAGFTHGFLVTFRSEKDRDAYIVHPAHQEFVKLVGPRLENVLVFDYWAKSRGEE